MIKRMVLRTLFDIVLIPFSRNAFGGCNRKALYRLLISKKNFLMWNRLIMSRRPWGNSLKKLFLTICGIQLYLRILVNGNFVCNKSSRFWGLYCMVL